MAWTLRHRLNAPGDGVEFTTEEEAKRIADRLFPLGPFRWVPITPITDHDPVTGMKLEQWLQREQRWHDVGIRLVQIHAPFPQATGVAA